MKVYPPQDSMSILLFGKEQNTSRALDRFTMQAKYLSERINLIQHFWNNRFDFDNVVPHLFSSMVTGILDSSGLRRNRSVLREVKQRSYSGKFKAHVMKIQLVCDLHGRVIWMSGPHPGTDNDGLIWKTNNPWNLMHSEESFLADKAYIGQQHVTGQFKKTKKSNLPPFKKAWNSIHGYYRVTVEHAFGYGEVFGFLRQIHRGHIGICENSIVRHQAFSRLIFEVCNLHYVIQKTLRRNLKPVFVNSDGVNLLPRLDDTPEMRLLRRRLHERHAKLLSSDSIFNRSLVVTGYTSKDFELKNQVWFYRIDARVISRGVIWSISYNKDNETAPCFSVRTSNGHYVTRLTPTMMIPLVDKNKVPSVSDFFLFRDNKSFEDDSVNTIFDIHRRRVWKSVRDAKSVENDEMLGCASVFFGDSRAKMRMRLRNSSVSLKKLKWFMSRDEAVSEPSDQCMSDDDYQPSSYDESSDSNSLSSSSDEETCFSTKNDVGTESKRIV